MSEKNKLRVEYVKSIIGSSLRQKRTLQALGLKRLGDVVEIENTPAMWGMLNKLSHLIQVKEIE